MNLFLGLDLGTSGTKAYLMDTEGRRAGFGYKSVHRQRARAGWSELDLWEVVECGRAAIGAALAEGDHHPREIQAARVASQRDTDFVWYRGWFATAAQARALLEHLAAKLNLDMVPGLSQGMVALNRGPFRILLNFTETNQEISIRGQTTRIGPLDVAVLGDGSA